MKRVVLVSILCLVGFFGQEQAGAERDVGHVAPVAADGKSAKKLTDAQIKKILIKESIAGYAGRCPCPYSRMRNGSRCGKRSAWSRGGGEAPLCYKRDVTAAMVQAYRDARPDS